MLTVKPSERFSMDDIINHKWFCLDGDANECEDLKNIVNQIENMYENIFNSNPIHNNIFYKTLRSINDRTSFQPDESVLVELKQLGVDTNLVLEVRLLISFIKKRI
jgi:hypothetical protein